MPSRDHTNLGGDRTHIDVPAETLQERPLHFGEQHHKQRRKEQQFGKQRNRAEPTDRTAKRVADPNEAVG